jgi:hypothetical protein
MEVSGQFLVSAGRITPGEIDPGTHYTESWSEYSVVPSAVGNMKMENICHYRESNPISRSYSQ